MLFFFDILRYELFIQGQIRKAINENNRLKGKKKSKAKPAEELDTNTLTHSILDVIELLSSNNC